MPDQDANKESIQQVADSVAEAADSDVLLLNGPMTRPLDVRVIDLCASRRRRSHVLLVLVTEGGDADPAYRIARCLQDHYDRFSLFVSGYCKSAGTLVALGAHELVIADCGELGPLDVQMSKEDELGATRSGLTVLSALSTLQMKAYDAFEHFLLETKKRSLGLITTRTAIRVATDLAERCSRRYMSMLMPCTSARPADLWRSRTGMAKSCCNRVRIAGRARSTH